MRDVTSFWGLHMLKRKIVDYYKNLYADNAYNSGETVRFFNYPFESCF